MGTSQRVRYVVGIGVAGKDSYAYRRSHIRWIQRDRFLRCDEHDRSREARGLERRYRESFAFHSAQGVRIDAQQPLEFANEADAVLIGSARGSREVVKDESILSRIRLDPKRQLIGSQCSGALILAKLGLLPTRQACTDRFTRPLVEAVGIEVLERSFMSHENVATAGGRLSAQYLATWVLWRLTDRSTAARALENVVPVGEEGAYVERALKTVEPFIGTLGLAKPAIVTPRSSSSSL